MLSANQILCDFIAHQHENSGSFYYRQDEYGRSLAVNIPVSMTELHCVHVMIISFSAMP